MKMESQMKKAKCFTIFSAIVLLMTMYIHTPSQTAAQNIENVRARYTKYEYAIPMRDGVKLFTQVYVPKDTSQRYPFILTRTPYSVSPYGVDNYRAGLGPSDHFEK